MDWKDLIDSTANFDLKNELRVLIEKGLLSTDDFERQQSQKMVDAIQQFGDGKISKTDFQDKIADILDLIEIEQAGKAIEQKANLQKYADKIEALLIQGLAKIL
jgi:hypothetical protein